MVEFYTAVGQAAAGTDNDPIWEVGVYPTHDELREYIQMGEMHLGEIDGQIAAAIVTSHALEEGYAVVDWAADVPLEESTIIHLFGMHPDFKGQGLSRKLLAAVEEELANAGDRVFRLDVVAENTVAQKVYERLGFTFCGTQYLEYSDYQGDFAFFEKEIIPGRS